MNPTLDLNNYQYQIIYMEQYIAQKNYNHIKQKLAELEKTIQNIKLFSQKIQYKTIAKLNSVCFVDVQLYHTSEILVSLGQDYFVQTTRDNALEIAQKRKKYLNQYLIKYQKLLKIYESKKKFGTKETKQTKQTKQTKETKEVTEKIGTQETKQIKQQKQNKKVFLEKDETGEQIFEIIEYPQQNQKVQTRKNTIQKIQQSTFQNKVEKRKQTNKQDPPPPIQTKVQKIKQTIKQNPPMQQKVQQEKQNVTPKKISKFKQQKMKEKGLL